MGPEEEAMMTVGGSQRMERDDWGGASEGRGWKNLLAILREEM